MSTPIIISFADHDFDQMNAKRLLQHLKSEKSLSETMVLKLINQYGSAAATINIITQDDHSNNLTQVNQTSAAAIHKLDTRYNKRSTQDELVDLKKFIAASDCTKQVKKDALKLIENVEKRQEVNSYSGKNLAETLALVWVATKDSSSEVNPEGKPFTIIDVAYRKNLHVKSLASISNESCINALTNDSQAICFTGIHNLIVATLDHCHTDVSINALSANLLLSPAILQYVRINLEQHPQKQHIIDNWLRPESDPIIDEWLRELQPSCENKIKAEYGSLFPAKVIEEFTHPSVLDTLPIHTPNQS